MFDDAPFLRAIWDAPHNDAPRLVYADWLEERGDTDRAELIRVQCELAPLNETDPRRTNLIVRQRDLLRHTANWMRRLPQCREGAPFRRDVVRAPFVRGFPNPTVRMTAVEFFEHAERLFRAAPLWRLQLYEIERAWADRAAAPEMRQVGDLSLDITELRDDELQPFTESPHLANLVAISLRYNELTTRGAYLLVSSPNLPRLRHVDLRENHIDAEGVHLLRERFGDGAIV